MKARNLFLTVCILLGLVWSGAAGAAGPGPASPASPASPAAGAPSAVSYQGQVLVSGVPFSGTGYFKFAVVDAAGATSYWSNDGTSSGGGEPSAAVALGVAGGLFNVLLGDTALPGMTQPLDAGVFAGPERNLRVWFSPDNTAFTQLAPDRRIAAAPYALQAANSALLGGQPASAFQQHYAGVVVVAKSGGDYTSVQAAIDSISAAGPASPYLVWVAPGVYSETVTLKPYVHLQGAGQEATVITSTAAGATTALIGATVVLTRNTSLRDLTAGNGAHSAGTFRAALLAGSGVTATLAADVTARVAGPDGAGNTAIVLTGAGVGVTMRNVTAQAENGMTATALENAYGAYAVLEGGSYSANHANTSWALYNHDGGVLTASGVLASAWGNSSATALNNNTTARATLRGGSYTSRSGGSSSFAIYGAYGGPMQVENVTAYGYGGSNSNYGLLAGNYTVVQGGTYTARGGNYAYGVYATGAMSVTQATGLAEYGIQSYGLYQAVGQLWLHGGSYTGRRGQSAYGVLAASVITATQVDALAENGTNNACGLCINSGSVWLQGGFYTARRSPSVFGIWNTGTLVATDASVLADYGSNSSYALYMSGGTTSLQGGSFRARGGTTASAIYNMASLSAENVSATGEYGANNYALYNSMGTAKLRGGSYAARLGASNVALYNVQANAAITAYELNAIADSAAGGSYGLWVVAGTFDGAQDLLQADIPVSGSASVTLANSRLLGGAVVGPVTCIAVSRGAAFNTNSCP